MSRTLLIVDDQADIIRILEREFKRQGDTSVLTATSKLEALEKMKRAKVELVVSDVRLGTDTGFALLEEINQQHPGTGTMLMTAYRSPGYRQQADALGVSFFLEKPFAVATLVTAVERFFQHRAAQAEAAKQSAQKDTTALNHFKPQDLIQLFCLNGRQVRLELRFSAKLPSGYIYIQKGRVLHAEFAGQEGEKAFYTMMHLPDAKLNLEDWTNPVPQTIKAGWEHLLLESARQTDHEEFSESEMIHDVDTPVETEKVDPFADFWKVADISLAKNG